MSGLTVSARHLVAIVFAGLLVRLAVLGINYHDLELDASFLVQGELARNILGGNGFSTNPQYMNQILAEWRDEGRLLDLEDIPVPAEEHLSPEYLNEPGYAILLAGLWGLFGEQRWIYVRVLQILIDLGMIVLVYRIGLQAWNHRVGAAAGLLYAFFLPHVELVVRPHRDVWVTFAYILSVAVLLYLLRTSHKRWVGPVILIAVSAGAVAWMRSTIVLYGVACAGAFFLVRPKGEALRMGAFLGLVLLLMLAPLVKRNYDTFGKLMITRGAVWHSYWAGIGQFPNPYGITEDDQHIAEYFRKKDSTAVYGTDAYERVLKERAWEILKNKPLWYGSTVLRRAAVIILPKIGRAIFFQSSNREETTGLHNQTLAGWVLLLIDGILAGGLFYGVWVFRHSWKILLLLGLPLLYTIVTLAPMYVVGRNILNVYFVTLLVAAASFDSFRTRFWPHSTAPE